MIKKRLKLFAIAVVVLSSTTAQALILRTSKTTPRVTSSSTSPRTAETTVARNSSPTMRRRVWSAIVGTTASRLRWPIPSDSASLTPRSNTATCRYSRRQKVSTCDLCSATPPPSTPKRWLRCMCHVHPPVSSVLSKNSRASSVSP